MRIDFTKMHGLGNDFIVFDSPAPGGTLLSAQQWRSLADRHTGIGFDQALVVEPARTAGTDVYYRIINADGNEVEQCGNGARCIAELLRREGRAAGPRIAMESAGGLVNALLPRAGVVAVDMGEPDFSPQAVAFETLEQSGPVFGITLPGYEARFAIVSMGNPHAVLDVDDVDSAPVATLGPALESHSRFTRRVNVGFRQIIDREHIRLRVFERGAGETLACGTGACAAVATGIRAGLLNSTVAVDLPGGRLIIRWAGVGNPLWLEGPAEVSFHGQFEI
jgi:diaminopimelate epimerase